MSNMEKEKKTLAMDRYTMVITILVSKKDKEHSRGLMALSLSATFKITRLMEKVLISGSILAKSKVSGKTVS